MSPKLDSSSREFLVVAAAALLVVFCYRNALPGPFVFDDAHNIAKNRFIRITSLDPAGLYAAAFKSPLPNRPVANVSFALNFYFNGFNAVGYRVVNILIHIVNGFLILGLARATFRTPALAAMGEKAGLAAALAALVWMVHPLHTQSVGYIVQRMTSLAALFYLLALLCYARARLLPKGDRRRIALFGGCGLAGLLSLGSKEIAATLPVFIYLYEWYFFQGLQGKWLRRSLPGLAGVCLLSAAIGLIFLGGRDPLAQIMAPYADGAITAGQRLLTQARAVCFYISLIFWPAPSRLNLDHDFPFSFSLLDPGTTLPALLVLAGLVALAFFLARRDALSSYAIFWFLGNLLIESSVIRLETVFEHRTYLPSVLPALALAALLFRTRKRRWPAVAVLSAIALLWTVWTWQRGQVWGDAVALWQDCVRKSPAKARPYNNLGSALSERNRLPEAAANFQKAIELRPNYGDAHYNLGYAWVRLGRLADGVQQLQKAVRLEPDNYMAHNNLGVAFLLQENYPEAIWHLQRAVDLAAEFETARNNLGVALKNSGDLEGAIHHFEQAVRINPNYAEAYNNLGLTLKDQGKLREAVENFRRALELNPVHAAARLNLQEAEARLKRAID
jgi:protein O-mannosyl-transferase